jgi:hypothetical protein
MVENGGSGSPHREQRRYDGDAGTGIAVPSQPKDYANVNSIPVTAILSATLVLPVVALADQHVRAQLDHSGTPSFAAKASHKKPLKHEQTTSVRGTVTAIDPTTRLVMLKTEDGRTFDVQAGNEVKNFDKVAVGDVIEATYTESVVFQIVPKGSANVGQKVTSSFEIASVDPVANILWVTRPNGTTQPIYFDEKSQARLMTLSPGVVVSATYTESAAIQLEKLAR